MRLRKPMKTADEYDALTQAKNVHHFRPGQRKKIKKTYNKKERRWLNRILMMGAKQDRQVYEVSGDKPFDTVSIDLN